MAKPGSDRARELAAMAQRAQMIDRGIPESMQAALLQQIEGKLGMRCGGCFRRITIGIQFTKLGVRMGEQGPEADVAKLTACNRDDCDFALEAKEHATAMEMVEFQWLDGKDIDAVELPQDAREDAGSANGASESADPEEPAGSAGVAHVAEGEEYPDAREPQAPPT